jgi:hypothetical protein
MSCSSLAADVAANLVRIRERMAGAAARAGRRPEDILLVAVTKQVDTRQVRAALEAGVTDIGENYVQEALAKRSELGGEARWHLIGHLQGNKAKQAVGVFDVIHTIDSLRIAEAVGKRARAMGRCLEVLLQVNTSGEGSKSGVDPQEAERLAEAAAGVEGIRLRGVMTIGRWSPDPEAARPEFRQLARIAGDLESRLGIEMKWLSMGMSHDFEVAIEEGASLVRVGTAVFGPRAAAGGPG